ncbi:39S ribosomal protein L43: mitochondrial-like protein [Dinothrombium tinctorium]|uniref:Large ribosomal subunit protein mL43 n=1 Tax=Dinothrombium tinctorium TaxID=1965070 RepID=A0A3S4QRY8_9ACAR|nr:39S ribosomal protein L43: mitochondrial-like protein [Dinothrombium tinctorium]
MRGRVVKPSFAVPQNYYNLYSFGTHRIQLSGFTEQPFYNGLGRYVCQLQRVTFKFCKFGGSSKGVREFIETDVVDFSRQHPGVVVYLKPRRHKTPIMVTEYLNGNSHWMNLRNMTKSEIKLWLDYMRTRSGEPIKRYRKKIKTEWPSIQGPWNPFLNMPSFVNVTDLPNEQRGAFISEKKSATQQLLEMAKDGSLKNILKTNVSQEDKE